MSRRARLRNARAIAAPALIGAALGVGGFLLIDAMANPAPARERAFASCAAAHAAGVAPIRRGEPGYAPHLDRDDDGVACEPYRR